jgi:hypothetical protein
VLGEGEGLAEVPGVVLGVGLTDGLACDLRRLAIVTLGVTLGCGGA